MSNIKDRVEEKKIVLAVLGAKRRFARASVVGAAEVGRQTAQLAVLTPVYRNEADAKRHQAIDVAVRPIIRVVIARDKEGFTRGYVGELDRLLHRD